MLQIDLPAIRFFDERTSEFVPCKPITLKLEHSLISIQKWESKWHKSYLSSKDLTPEQTIDYVRCMSIGQEIDEFTLRRLSQKDLMTIRAYIENPMTATTFPKENGRRKKIITAEVIYYWMTALNIPFDCAKWHLNQLMTLIQVCSIMNNPKKNGKKNAASAAKARSDLNNARKARLGTKG